MNKEDYFKYYIQGSDHYLIPKDVFKELFNEMESWKQNTNKYKEVIDKAIENEEEIMYLANKVAITTQNIEVKALRDRLEEIFDILKKVSE